jgi:serine/threonine protein phosphatase PrpC
MSLRLRYAVRSDRGLVRDNNEDSVYAGPRLLAIADGMGGHAGGEVASQLVIGVIERLDEDRPLDDLLNAMREAVDDANVAVAESVAREPQLDGMGTTLTALRFVGSRVGVVHVGDSRAYLLRDEVLTQITHDDTYVQSLVDAGQITAEEATTHPRKSVILRAMTGTIVEPDLSIREVRAGDRYLLCTDGLTDVVSAPTLRETLSDGTPQECADQLVDLALRGGGPDNVTCIVAEVGDDGYFDDLPVVAGAVGGEGDRPSAATVEDSPAARARASRVGAEPVVATEPEPRRRRWRSIVLLLIVVAAVVAAGGGFYRWTQQQYYVGATDASTVAIFRGISSQLGPLHLSSVVENAGIRVKDLTEVARTQVRSGIDATSLDDARKIVRRLENSQLPACVAPTPVTPSPSPTSPDPSPSPTTSPVPTAAPAPSTSPSASASTPTSASADSTPVPGIDCRDSS